ncbi:hypothetical protein H6P81_002960 [Aristolochia fimbriata]|uniref:Retrotransposon gag domain-containing protein n=1 Tax=Aristolochia fimbriata TaxID=158543 RepID=A0AAV7FB73_ARIFI|nr:hypothetical protein H6P81_002960 [Aristolochia fimbriata]
MIQNSYQFGVLSNEDPNKHIERFLQLCDSFKFEDDTNEAVWLRLFPFTLRDRAKSWYYTLPPDSIRTWEELQKKFLGKYFPPAKTIKLRNAISNFMQEHDEQLFEAWERLKELLRKCPNHGIPRWMQMEIFYNGITVSTRSLIDVATGGTMNKKTPNEVYELIEEMASNMYQYPVERSARGRVSSIHNVDHVLALQAQVESLTKQLSKLHTPSLVAQICDMCEGRHPNHECQAGKNQGTLPRNFETSPKEVIKAISLRSGKVLEEQKQPQVEEDKANQQQDKKGEEQDKGKEVSRQHKQKEAPMQMPQYAKFVKEVLSGKRIEEQGTVMLTKNCSAILKNQLPTKLKDPESFTIPCEFRNFKFNKVLCDLGASINLIPLSICRKLNLGELKETNIMLQFADRSTKNPNGLIEDVLVRIGKFIYPCDFVVQDVDKCLKDTIFGHIN